MSKGVCKYCGKAMENEHRHICNACANKITLIRHLIKATEPLRVVSQQRKARLIPNDR